MSLKGDTGRGICESRKHWRCTADHQKQGERHRKDSPLAWTPNLRNWETIDFYCLRPQLILLCCISPPSKVILWGCLNYGLWGLGVQFSSFKSYVNKWKYQSEVSESLFPFKVKCERCKDVKRKIKEKHLTHAYSSFASGASVCQQFNKFIKLKTF